ncbi:MAG: peptidoglycan DD-metalloendopeptidase family protein [Prevotellaceae bacterium]|nr:peptidoglycan DD-metalloendopeptidase family protein [Prevotellaceae bacterium]
MKHILTIAFLFASVVLFSQSAEEKLKKSKADTEKEIEKLTKQLSAKTKAKQSESTQAALLHSRIEQRKKLINDTDIQIAITESEIEKKNKKINDIKFQINRLKEAYSELVVNIYTNRKKATWLMYVFASEDFSQAYRRLKYLQSYADVVVIQARKIEQTNQQLAKEIALLSDKMQELNNYKSERKQEIERLAQDEAAAKRILNKLKNEEAKLKKQLQRKNTELANLNKKIEELLKKEIAKDKSTGFSKLPVNVKLSADFVANRGRLPWPVSQGKITGSFGTRFHPVYKNIKIESKGIDISTVVGENVLATFDGVVVGVLPVAGMNMCVIVRHGEYLTIYCKLGSVNVKNGAAVKTGTVLGRVAARNDEDGPQLHFELCKEYTFLNPQLWLAKK